MGTLTNAFLFVSVVIFATFVIFFGRLPAFRNTPIGALNRSVLVHLPQGVLAVDRRVTGGKVSQTTANFFRFMMNERHPTVLILFLLLMLVPEYLFVPSVWPTLGAFAQLGSAIIILLPYTFLYLSARGDPGIITRENHNFYGALYPYDHTIFHPGKFCQTCNLVKPARSKHCSLCGYCVAKSDHHCIFINGCVGYGNHHWFMLLLLSTATLTTVGTMVGGPFLLRHIQKFYPSFTFRRTHLSWSDYFSFWSFALADEPWVGSITLLTLLISPLIWGLATYHLYLIWAGTTTNESGKWSDLKLDMDDGTIFKRSLPPNRERDPRFEPKRDPSWPTDSLQIVIHTSDCNPPNAENSKILAGEGEWQQVWSLRDIDNLYDLGFRKNLADVFFDRKKRLLTA